MERTLLEKLDWYIEKIKRYQENMSYECRIGSVEYNRLVEKADNLVWMLNT